MNVNFTANLGTAATQDSLVIGSFAATSTLALPDPVWPGLEELLQNLPANDKRGNNGEWEHYTLLVDKTIRHVILYGLGKREDFTPDSLRKATGHSARLLNNLKVASACLVWPELGIDKRDEAQFLQAAAEGIRLGLYHFSSYKEKPASRTLAAVMIYSACPAEVTATVAAIAQTVAEYVLLARDMVNHPAIHLTPTRMAEMACELQEKTPALNVEVLDMPELKAKGMHAFAAVAQGSAEPAKLIVMKYTGNPQSDDLIAFVGKGITFDSGGISLKPSENMGEMKGDMAGGAAVIAALGAIARLGLRTNVLGVIPCTENMPSGTAFRPGDVVSTLAGKTIEIISTDAEGRLILADAITFAKERGAKQIVDLATLTGACMVALGTINSGVITNNRVWCDQVLAAGKASGEKLWEMPHDDEYKELIRSDIADMKNSGGRWGGMITAGLLLGEFAGNTPWVHIDIAGTADTTAESGYTPKGATGAMVRLLVELAGAC